MPDARSPQIKKPSNLKIKRISPYITIQADFISKSASLPGKTLHVAMAYGVRRLCLTTLPLL